MHILHIITGLGQGGAEATLFRVISADKTNQHTVVSLTSAGDYGGKFRTIGIDVLELKMASSFIGMIHGITALSSLIRENEPHIVQTWLYKADLMGGLAAWLAGHRAVIWNIRSSPPELKFSKPSTFFSLVLLTLFSWWIPSRIVACGEAPRQSHASIGYRSSRMRVIPNGLEASIWRSNEKDRLLSRSRLKIRDDVLTFGQIANYHPIKRHSLLLRAFKQFSHQVASVHLVLAGQNIDKTNKELVSLLEELSMTRNVTLAGKQKDSRALLNAIDVLVSPSASEGFPNVVLEALFMGKPCLVSDAGESARIIGPGGWVFAPETVEGLSNALIDAANIGASSLREIGASGRHHVMDAYSEHAMVAAYQRIWLEVEAEKHR